ncbi:Peptide-N4-(N-acetyl-beta-glucosaminyl)asparagine amidase A, putative [Ricinus communis]|uniref:Peptide-N4-(N-acetyl-beta-glucosaminyl)asparagine amidase A, putative n=1 Tax=Ricinus communis TaxID=3988 RepID=B9S455_RICCO|nr:Peptide-N4-(N-acetyl-beta-glucosaminyl)asparagine amidase A, putative [Ricinus communis]|eukprot:XP_002520774.1 peptide-N4-(N-acetyl-beta-glucosaminyl)asparagine amidase A [Ricinus communis]
METPSSLLLLLLLLLTPIFPLTLFSFPDHYLKQPSSSSPRPPSYKESFEVIHPLPSDHLTPSCALHIIHHTFGNTINHPPYSVPYSPPSDCSSPWPHVALEFRANSIGNQYDRISGLWLGGAELLRTSTAEPTETGIYWSIRKDITRYSSLLKQRNVNFTVMLENIINDVYTGAYHVDVTLFFYKDATVSLPFKKNHLAMLPHQIQAKVVYETPSDLIIPISSFHDNRGYWFRIEDESDVQYKKLRFPRNTRKAVLELYVSFHGNDEFWYSNPSNTYIRMNNLTSLRGNGAFREVFFTIDGMFVDSEVPFPVIFSGGINPLFWDPAVAIGAFDLPTYDFDLTPFLGILLDGKDHVIGIGVANGISYWLVDANLHIWLDKGAASVVAKSVTYQNPGSSVKRQESFRMLDGSFAIKGTRKTKLVGWIKSSVANLTVAVSHGYKFRSSVRFAKNGTYKQAKQSMKSSREVRIMNEKGLLLSRVTVKRMYPLNVITWNLPGPEKDMYTLITNVSHALVDNISSGKLSSSVNNKQVANGWMDVKGHYVVSGKAIMNQTLTSRDDESGCYVRTAAAIDGSIVRDNSTYACPSFM